jgi:GAF domain-containing protein
MGVVTHEREAARARAVYFRHAPRGAGESSAGYVRRFSENSGGTGDRWQHTSFLRDAMERGGGPLVLDHVSTDPRLDGAAIKHVGAESAVLLPLTMGDEFVAALVVARTTPAPFSPDEIAILEDVARPVTTAVANALAFEEIQRLRSLLEEENVALREEIAATAAAGGIIGSSPALHQVLERVRLVASHGVDHRRDGDRKRAACPRDPRGVTSSEAHHGEGQLRGAPGRTRRFRAVRP